MLKRLVGVLMVAALLVGLLPYPSVSAGTSKGDCFYDANQARMPRPSGAIGSDGKEIKFDYSNLPDPKDLIFICVNGKFLTTDVPVEMERGSTLIPMRALLETLNADIDWDGNSNTVTAKLRGKTIKLQVDNPKATINGQTVTMDVPPRMKQGRVLIPVRFVSEQLDCTVAWQPGSKIVRIFTSPELSVKDSNKTVVSRSDDYDYSNYFKPASRFLFENNKQTIVVDAISDELKIQQLNSDLVKSKEFNIKYELPLVGGVHLGEDGYYYVIYGQDNMEESDSKAVYRIVKYDDSWAKVAQIDIKDVYVTLPFHASNLTMDSYQGKLVIHNARQRYLTEDGLHHQSNITFQINVKDMTLINDGGEWPRNHVSHSFATFVRFDGDQIVYADHGDAYPRSIVLQVEQDEHIISAINLLKFPGEIGDNYTGAHLGGLEVAKDNYLMVGSSVSLKEQYGKSKAKNLFLGVVPKNAKDDSEAKVNWLTNHAVTSSVDIMETHLVKINEDKFVLLWTESDSEMSLFYAVVDGTGKLLHNPTKLDGVPSPGNIEPLVRGNSVIWYSYNFVYQNRYKQDGAEFYSLLVE